MPLFSPPTHEEPMRTTVKPLCYMRLTYAASIVKVDGHFRRVRTPSHDLVKELEEGFEWFRGGYVYRVTDEVAAELELDGYETTEEPIVDPEEPGEVDLELGYGEGRYGYGRYGL